MIGLPPSLTRLAAFERYEAIRDRLPLASANQGKARQVHNLIEIADEADGFVFDAYGVLNIGKQPIKGAADCIAHLRAMGKAVRVLTNAASLGRAQTVQKFRDLGFDFAAEEILSSREICLQNIEAAQPDLILGVMADDQAALEGIVSPTILLDDQPKSYAQMDAVLMLGSGHWTPNRQSLLCNALQRRPVPVFVANPDLVAPRETGLSLEPGYFAHDLQEQLDLAPRFFGKPFPEIFAATEAGLGLPPGRIVMVGDTLHTDILGAQTQGWRTLLVAGHGMYAGMGLPPLMTRSGIFPDWITPSI